MLALVVGRMKHMKGSPLFFIYCTKLCYFWEVSLLDLWHKNKEVLKNTGKMSMKRLVCIFSRDLNKVWRQCQMRIWVYARNQKYYDTRLWFSTCCRNGTQCLRSIPVFAHSKVKVVLNSVQYLGFLVVLLHF